MTKEDSMEFLLVNIRSVVLSKKGGVPLNSLQADFRTMIGERIPFETYNFESLYAFLMSIPQCVRLKKCNNQFYVEAVPNGSTSHLSNLISKQKGTKSKKVQFPQKGFRPTNLTKSSSNGSSSNVSIASQDFEENIKKAPSLLSGFGQANLTKNVFSGSSSNVSIASQHSEENLVIKNLKSNLANEQKMNQDSALEILRLKSELKNVGKALEVEQECSKNLRESLENLKVSFEKKNDEVERNNLLIKYHIHEIENLKMSLEKEKKTNEIFTSEMKSKKKELEKLQKQVEELQSSSKDNENYRKEIKDLESKFEKEKRISRAFSNRSEHLKTLLEKLQISSDDEIKKLRNQLRLQEKREDSSFQKEELNSGNTAVDLSATDIAKELKSNDPIPDFCDHIDQFVKLDDKIAKIKKDLQLQSLDIKRTMNMQQQHYSKMDSRIKKHCDSIGMDTILKNMLVHPLFLQSLQSSLNMIAESGMSSASTTSESSAIKSNV